MPLSDKAKSALAAASKYAAAAFVVLCAFLAGQYKPDGPKPVTPSIALPESVTVLAGGGAVKVEVATKSKTAHVRWIVYPGDEGYIQVLPYSDHAQVIALKPGTYWLGADLSTADGDAVWCQINANQGPQPPPVPPTPPVPPAPTPSPLTQKLQAAYDVDLDPYKAANLTKLTSSLAGVVKRAKDSNKVKTAKDLQTFVKSDTDAAITATGIPKVRAEIGVYLSSVLPTAGNTKADDGYWAKADSEYGYVALSLKGVK